MELDNIYQILSIMHILLYVFIADDADRNLHFNHLNVRNTSII